MAANDLTLVVDPREGRYLPDSTALKQAEVLSELWGSRVD